MRVPGAILWALVLCLAVAATNRYEAPPQPAFVLGDAYAYFMLAQAAPGLPKDQLSFHHAQRIVIPYVLGVIGHVVPVPIHRLFQILVVLMAAAILAIVAAILNDLSVHRPQAILVLAILAFNPWAFRPYLTFPEMVNDLGFVLGLAILLRGLLKGRAAPVLLGQLVASASRQTGLLLVPVVAVWLWRDRARWGEMAVPRRLALCLASGVLAASVYAATAQVAARFSGANENAMHLVGMWSWLAMQFDTFVLAAFLARVIISPLILVGLLLVMSGSRRTHGTDSDAVPILLFASMCIWAQPLLAGPEITAGNGPRLLTIGLLPLCLALAIRLRDAGVFAGASSSRRLLCGVALLALGSMHHWYVLARVPSLTHKVFFALAYALACAGCVALTAFEVRDAQRRSGSHVSIA